MQLEAFLWLFLPVFVAGGSALLSYYVMQARMEVALAKERETLAEARAAINSHKVTLDERVRATEESTKRQALDDFMHDIRTEERSYVRESTDRKIMVMQERLYFRNIPLSNWIDHEMLIEDGAPGTAKLQGQISKESVFMTKPLAAAPPPSSLQPAQSPQPRHEDTALALSKLLQEVQNAQIVPLPEPASLPQPEPQAQVLLTHHATAFGAQ